MSRPARASEYVHEAASLAEKLTDSRTDVIPTYAADFLSAAWCSPNAADTA